MTVDAERMRENLELTHGALFSQRVLLALVEAGMERDEAYRIVQAAAQRAWDERHAAARAARGRARRARASTSTRVFDYGHSRPPRATRSSGGWTRSPAAPRRPVRPGRDSMHGATPGRSGESPR